MRIHIETDDEAEREHIICRLLYSLNAMRQHIDRMRLSLEPDYDALGKKLYRCLIHTVLRDGRTLELEEAQSRCDLALNRALERCSRALQRRLHGPQQRRAT